MSYSAEKCDHCQLPMTIPDTHVGPAYCCSGCRFMASVMTGATSAATEENKDQAALVARLFLCVLLSVIVMMFSLILYAEDVLPHAQIGANSPEQAIALRGMIRLFCLAAATPVLLILGKPILRDIQLAHSWQEKATESLIFVGSLSAFLLSVFNTFYDGPKVYFETATVVLVLMTIGRGLDARARSQATKKLSQLSDKLPRTANKLSTESDTNSETVEVESLEIGDLVRVKIGEVIPIDGKIIAGRSEIDEALVTGEFESRKAETGERVYAGSQNLSGELTVEVTSTASEGTIYQIEALVAQAWSEPGYRVELAQRWSRRLLPLALILALVSGSAWAFYEQSFMTGIQVGLSVLLIACPCALGIATPMALWFGLKNCAKLGIFPRSGSILEDLSQLEYLYLDKTGTLTECRLQLADAEAPASDLPDGVTKETSLKLAAKLASYSDHVVSQALLTSLEHDVSKEEQTELSLNEVQEVKGRGLEAVSEYGPVRIGSAAFCEVSDNPHDLFLTVAGHVALSWKMDEALRPGAKEAVEKIKSYGVKVCILSGDRETRVATVAQQLNVEYHAEMLPEEKMRKISQVAKDFVVGMLGDGLNDAPALAAATVGFAMADGLEVTREVADGVILGTDLRKFADLLDLAEDVIERIRWNLTWAFLFNAIGLILAVSNKLNPVWAALAMLLSSSSIVASNFDREEGNSHEQDRQETQDPVQESAPIPALSSAP